MADCAPINETYPHAHAPDRDQNGISQALQARLDHYRSVAKTSAQVELHKEFKWSVYGWLRQDNLSVWFGPTNSGKTFSVLDLAAHVACGEKWFGHEVKQGPVLYLALEGGAAIEHRVLAMRKKLPTLEGAPFILVPDEVNLFRGIDAEAMALLIAEIKPAMVVVDTLARSMVGGSENSTDDMGILISNCDKLRRVCGSHVLIVHHTGKDEDAGPRGAYALPAGIDTLVEVTKDRELICRKQRDTEYPPGKQFTLRQVKLGVDERGYDITSCIVEGPDPFESQRLASEAHSRLGAHKDRIMQVLNAQDEPITIKEIIAQYDALSGDTDEANNSIDQKYLGNILRQMGGKEAHVERRAGKATLYSVNPDFGQSPWCGS